MSSSEFCDSMIKILVTELETLSGRSETGAPALPTQDSSDLLACALSCVSDILCTSELGDAEANMFFDRLSQYADQQCIDGAANAPAAVSISRAIHQTAALLYNFVCNENPPGHPSMESYVDGLLTAMDKVPHEAWDSLPILLLFMYVHVSLTLSTRLTYHYYSVSVGFGTTCDPTWRSTLRCYFVRPLVLGGKERFPEWRRMALQLVKTLRTLRWWVDARNAEDAAVGNSNTPSSRRGSTKRSTRSPKFRIGSRKGQSEHLTASSQSTCLPRRRRLPSEILEADQRFQAAVDAILDKSMPVLSPGGIKELGTTPMPRDSEDRTMEPATTMTKPAAKRLERLNILATAQKVWL